MIRELKTLDDPLWPALVELYESSFDRDSREPLSQLEEEIRGEYRLPFRYFIDDEDGRLRGFARWCDLGYAAFLIHIAVSPAVQGKGIGHGLMEAIFRVKDRMILEADAEDERLMRFYAGFGAKVITPDYTQPPLHKDTDPVGFALVGIGEFDDSERAIRDFYRDVWGLSPDHPFVLRAMEGMR